MTAIPIIRFDSLDSTSSRARRLLEADPHTPAPFIVLARTQTAGRGQFTRSWSSPLGGLWCTHAWPLSPLPNEPEAQARVSLDALGLRLGLACARTVESALRRAGNGNDARLKWPNDIYVVGKKVLGVLTEGVSSRGSRFLLIGVGINANFTAADLPADVAPHATTIRDRAGADIDLEVLLDDLTTNLQRALGAPALDRAALAEARSRLHGVGREAEIRTRDAQTVRGTLLGLDDHGCPLIRTPAGDITGVALEPSW